MSSFDLCNLDEFVAEVTAQPGSLEEAASTQEIIVQQLENYLQRMKAAICADLESLAGGGGVTTFLGLTDTPAAYAGAAGDVATVNAGMTALEFTTPAAPGGLPDLDDDTEVASGRQFNGVNTFFKLVNIGALPNTATKSVAHNIGAAFAMISGIGAANNPVIPQIFPIIHTTTSFDSNDIWFYLDATNLNVVTGNNRTSYTNSFVVLEYYYL